MNSEPPFLYIKIKNGFIVLHSRHTTVTHENGLYIFARVFYLNLTPRETFKFLQIIFCVAEQSLNAHPVTPVSTDPNEFEALKTYQFLVKQPSVNIPSVEIYGHFYHHKRYFRAQSYAIAIWTREYGPLLNKRHK